MVFRGKSFGLRVAGLPRSELRVKEGVRITPGVEGLGVGVSGFESGVFGGSGVQGVGCRA